MNASQKPLAGVRVLVGRARHQASKLANGLEALGADVIRIPFIEIRPPRSYKPFDRALRRISEHQWLILTSVNGVEALSMRLTKLKIQPTQLAHLRVAAIGPATCDAIQELGLKVSVVPLEYIAESVVQSLRRKVSGQQVLLLRAKIARDVIPRELTKAGATVDVVEVYETVVPRSSKLKLEKLMQDPNTRPDIVTFTSSSTVRNFVALIGGRKRPPHAVLDQIKFASIGPVTSATLREFGLPVHIQASEYTIAGLTRAIVGLDRRA